ncbi:hypothetical protein HHK36_004572 [Tetracentron sinense]|uniref:SUI1 domain-containing protein n=1 Tax=Tetracentron sinense TaxID=13715 RepID=A0A834ZVH1_TETSI|nr:hypothetical protein HHK36_004572 [Tetracentron sinense]
MFKKSIEAKALQRLSGADRKKLKRTIKERFPQASDADIDVILPPKAEITVAKFPNRVHVFGVEGGFPMLFDVDGRGTEIFPTGHDGISSPHPEFSSKGYGDKAQSSFASVTLSGDFMDSLQALQEYLSPPYLNNRHGSGTRSSLMATGWDRNTLIALEETLVSTPIITKSISIPNSVVVSSDIVQPERWLNLLRKIKPSTALEKFSQVDILSPPDSGASGGCVSFLFYILAVYALWKVPELLPAFMLKGGEVSRFIIGGADLMFPGISIPAEGLPPFLAGQTWAVKVPGNPAPIAVSLLRTAIVLQPEVQLKVLTKSATESAEGHYVPNAGFLEDVVLEDPSLSSVCQVSDSCGDVSNASSDQQNGVNNGEVHNLVHVTEGHPELEPDTTTQIDARKDISEQIIIDVSDLNITNAVSAEESNREKVQHTLSTEEIDALLDKCLLQALHTSVKDKDLPMPGSTLWTHIPNGNWMLENRRGFRSEVVREGQIQDFRYEVVGNLEWWKALDLERDVAKCGTARGQHMDQAKVPGFAVGYGSGSPPGTVTFASARIHNFVVGTVQGEAVGERILEKRPLNVNGLDVLVLKANRKKSSHVLPCRPPGITLDTKKSSHKKLSKWLQSKSSAGLITAKEDKHKKEVVLLAVNRSHPDYISFKPEKRRVEEVDQTSDSTASESRSHRTQLEVAEIYKPSVHVNTIFTSVGADTGRFFSASEATDIVFRYIENENLVKPTDKAIVVLDAKLCDALYKGTIKKGSTYPTEIHKKDIGAAFVNRMQVHQRVTRGNESVVRKGSLKTIQIMTERRQGNKKVTKLSGLESFLMDAEALASELQKKFACSTSVAELPGKKGHEVLVQGGVIEHLGKYLVEHYGIPKRYIEVLDKTKK